MGWLMPLLKGAAPFLGGLVGQKLSGQSAVEKQSQQTLLDMMQKAGGFGDAMMPYAKDSAARVSSYYSPFLGPTRAPALAAAAPEISSLDDSYNQSLQSSKGMRTGGTASFLAEAPYRKAGQVTSLLAGKRAEAAGAMGNLMNSTAGAAGNFMNTAAGGARSLFDAENQRKQMQMQAGQGWGNMLYQLMQQWPQGGGGGGKSGFKLPSASGSD
jgi:hypothetical protein